MTGADEQQPPGHRGFRADARLGREAIAHIGARYSRFVGFMKFALPLGAAILIGTIIAWPDPYERGEGIHISLAEISLGENGEPGLVSVRYVGKDDRNQPFVITAGRVVPDAADPERFALKDLHADITTEDGTWVTLIADAGTYQRDQRKLALAGHVRIFSDEGFEIRTPTAEIDLAKGHAIGHEPVHGQGPLGNLNAASFRLIDKGVRIIFEGDVSLMVYPKIASRTD
jgi:lipopolysaccharide export system protein LptC